MWGKAGDSPHEIITDVHLLGGGKLHRFNNAAGDACSAIYVKGEEIWWHYRENEERMIREWNELREEENERPTE